MKPNGDWEPIDEVRAAWRPRVDLPHELFEFLLRAHMGRGPGHAGYDSAAAAAHRSAAAINAVVEAAAARPDISRLRIARLLPADGHMAQDLRAAMAYPLQPADDPARTAWAAQVFVAALEPHMPKNYWCAHPVLEDAFTAAIEDSREPGSYYFASTLCAYQRMQALNAALPHIAMTLEQSGHAALGLAARHVYSRLHASMADIRSTAARQREREMTAAGIIPLRRLNPRPS